MPNYPKTAVAIGDLKNSALYFDHLVPVFLGLEMLTDRWLYRDDWKDILNGILANVLPRHLLSAEFGDDFGELNARMYNLLQKFVIRDHDLDPEIKGLTQSEYDRIEEVAAQTYFAFIHKHGLGELPLAAAGDVACAGFPEGSSPCVTPLLTLSRLPLVDASHLSWEHIHELRKDPRVQERLRRLRLFAYANYEDKPLDYVTDDILMRIADYESCAKEWGITTAHGALSVVLDSKLIAGGLAGSLVATLFGQPLTALAAVAATAALEFGKYAIEFKQSKIAIATMARENPLSYVTYLRKQVRQRSANKASHPTPHPKRVRRG